MACNSEKADYLQIRGSNINIVSVLLHLSRMVKIVLESVVEVSLSLILTLAPYDCFVMARSFKVSKW